jgi:hypothetical protein
MYIRFVSVLNVLCINFFLEIYFFIYVCETNMCIFIFKNNFN